MSIKPPMTSLPLIALIDCDFIVYRACAAAEDEIDFGEDVIFVQSRFSDVIKNISRDLERIYVFLERTYHREPFLFLLFSDSENFRKLVDPAYKGHRNRKKPCGYVRAQKTLAASYKVVRLAGLEADDTMGIMSQTLAQAGNEVVICSPDKDMRQIPGQLWDLNPESPIQHISPEDGWRWFLTQTMTGDQTDGYSGIPGIGKVKADALIDKYGPHWETVHQAFLKAGLTTDDALRNARLARILTADDFDFATGTPRLWEPRGTDGGPAVRSDLQPDPLGADGSQPPGGVPDPWGLSSSASSDHGSDPGAATEDRDSAAPTQKRRFQKRKGQDA